ncbi:hypothetical protein D9M71_403590 [compost metagenome]
MASIDFARRFGRALRVAFLAAEAITRGRVHAGRLAKPRQGLLPEGLAGTAQGKPALVVDLPVIENAFAYRTHGKFPVARDLHIHLVALFAVAETGRQHCQHRAGRKCWRKLLEDDAVVDLPVGDGGAAVEAQATALWRFILGTGFAAIGQDQTERGCVHRASCEGGECDLSGAVHG